MCSSFEGYVNLTFALQNDGRQIDFEASQIKRGAILSSSLSRLVLLSNPAPQHKTVFTSDPRI